MLEGGDLEHVALQRAELDALAEQLAQVLLAAPQRRRLRAGRRRRGERPHRPEQRADHALGRPAQQPDRAARAADAHELVGDVLVVRREHRADRGHDDVERLVLERQLLGVGLHPLELEPLGLRAARGRPRAARASGRWPSRCAPACAAGIAALPVPEATSSTRMPGPIPHASTSRGPSGSRNVSTMDG